VLSTHEAASYSYPYPHPAVAADVAVFTLREGKLALLLIRRGGEPFKGMWALPGGFLEPDEDLDACARRELLEETGVEAARLRCFGNFSAPRRDPRERVISVAYLALLRSGQIVPKAGSDAAAARWFDVEALPPVAFDHAEIVEAAVGSLRANLDDGESVFDLAPERFTLSQLQAAYEAISGRRTDKRNFRKKFEAMARATGETERGPHRPARIFMRKRASRRA
jgi:8-oxo-dGTP diphosphatase